MGPDFRVLVAKARKSAQAYWKIYGEYPSTRVLVGEIATVMQEATQSGYVGKLGAAWERGRELMLVWVRTNRGVRPFGVSLLVAGYDKAKGHTLYQVDPSGSFWAWKASAIGKNQVNAKTFLEKRFVSLSRSFLPPHRPILPCPLGPRVHESHALLHARRYNDDLSLEDAIHTALLTLKEGFEGVMTEKTIEIGVISTAGFDENALALGGHGTGDLKSPGFRKLTEAEVAE